MAMEIFKGMFKANEVPLVDEILEGRSIFVMLQEELRQAAMQDQLVTQQSAASDVGVASSTLYTDITTTTVPKGQPP